MPPNKPYGTNRRHLLGFREPAGEHGVRGLTAAVARPVRYEKVSVNGIDISPLKQRMRHGSQITSGMSGAPFIT